jgi:hypothetical protein
VPSACCAVMPTLMAQSATLKCEKASALGVMDVQSGSPCTDEPLAHPWPRDFNPKAIDDQPRLGRGHLLHGSLLLLEAENHSSRKTPSAGLSGRATTGFRCGHDEEDVKKTPLCRMGQPGY